MILVQHFKNLKMNFKNSTLNIWTKGVNFYHNSIKNIRTTTDNLLKMSKRYSNISLISLGALTGAGIAFIFGLGFMSILPKVSSGLFVKLVGGMFVAVPSAGILGGTLVSKYLLKPNTDSTDKFKRFADVTLLSLSAVASASLMLVFGLGTLSLVNTLLPGLSTSVSLATIALTPLSGIVGGSKMLSICNAGSSLFCSRTPKPVVSANARYLPKGYNPYSSYSKNHSNISRDNSRNRSNSNNISNSFYAIRTVSNNKQQQLNK